VYGIDILPFDVTLSYAPYILIDLPSGKTVRHRYDRMSPTTRQNSTPAASGSTLPGLTLEEKLEAANQRIAELEAIQERQDAESELASRTERIRQLESDLGRLREGAGYALVTRPRAAKTRDLPIYKGRNIKEAQAFFYAAELKWREDKDMTWVDDAAKVTHCVSCFEGTPVDTWKRRERAAGVDNTSWEDFVTFMKNSISDPANRNITAVQHHQKAMQRFGQSVPDFLSYLDSLEDELPSVNDETRRNNLFGKLRPDTQREISLRGTPATREQLISMAITMENTMNTFNKNRERRAESLERGRYDRIPKGSR
jgi:hypothetical protein